MQFSIKWAAASAAYVGMAFGAWRMWPLTTGTIQKLFGIGVGMLFGGGLALPLAATNLVAAALAVWLTRGQDFVVQFATFATLSSLLYMVVLRWLDSALRSMGGLHLEGAELLLHIAFVLATFAVGLALMAFAPAPKSI